MSEGKHCDAIRFSFTYSQIHRKMHFCNVPNCKCAKIRTWANKAISCAHVLQMQSRIWTDAYVSVPMCLWFCCYHSHSWHQSLSGMGQMFTSVPVDTNKSKQLEEEASEEKIRQKQPPWTMGSEILLLVGTVRLLKDFTHSRWILSQSFPVREKRQSKERLRDTALISFCKFYHQQPCFRGSEKRERKPLGQDGQ